MFDQYQRHVTVVLRPYVPATLQLVTQLYSGRFWRTTALTTLDTDITFALFLSLLIWTTPSVVTTIYPAGSSELIISIYRATIIMQGQGQRIIIKTLYFTFGKQRWRNEDGFNVDCVGHIFFYIHSCSHEKGVLPSAFIRHPQCRYEYSAPLHQPPVTGSVLAARSSHQITIQDNWVAASAAPKPRHQTPRLAQGCLGDHQTRSRPTVIVIHYLLTGNNMNRNV